MWARGELKDGDEADRESQQAEDDLDADAAVFGLRIIRPECQAERFPPFYLWPENLGPWKFFLECVPRWRHGAGGAVGLDLAEVERVLPRFLRTHGFRRHERGRFLRLLSAMERGALAGWGEAASERLRKGR